MNTSRKTTKKVKKKSTWRRNAVLISLGLAAALLVGGLYWYINVCRLSYSGEDVRIYVPHGSSVEALSDTLHARLGDEYGSRVFRLWKLRGGAPETAAGSYVVSEGLSTLDLARKILVGAEDPVKVTFNNIRTMDQLASRVSRYMEFSADDFLAACDTVLGAKGYISANFPAAFLPDTYEFYWSAAPDYVVKRLVDVRDKFWTAERLQTAAALGLTPEQVATVASIVEEETIKSDERPKVARLYLNRLSRGMKLQADPTVKFAVGDFSIRRITAKHLAANSPYNTYMHAGLPPGPIRVVERKTLEDVLYAPMHDYLYMCAKEDFSGYHNFAVNDQQHMANARRYHAALNARGIR